MDDEKIIELYWERNALAIDRTAEKYGNYCSTIARNILVVSVPGCVPSSAFLLPKWDRRSAASNTRQSAIPDRTILLRLRCFFRLICIFALHSRSASAPAIVR